MATFRFPDDFKEHKEYVVLLKKALLQVKGETQKKFLYYKEYPFGAKKFQLVLVDYDPNCLGVLAKAGHRPTDEGMVSLTPQDQLDFEPKKGNLKRVRLKKYFATMGSGIKEVYVPPGEVDEEAGPQPGAATQPGAVPTQPGAVPTQPGAATTQPAASPTQPQANWKAAAPTQAPPRPTTPAPELPPTQAPSLNKQMEQKVAFEEAKFKLRQRIEELRAKPCPPDFEAKRNEALSMATALLGKGDFPNATKLLDQLGAKLAQGPASAPPKPSPQPEPPVAPARARSLSAYMGTTKEWKDAKRAAGNGILALKNAIFAACDPELKGPVTAKINQLDSIFALMDDAIIGKIQDASSENDEERQAEKNKALAQFAGKQLAAIRSHPLGPLADKNAFGTFTICSPVETVLTKITSTFAG